MQLLAQRGGVQQSAASAGAGGEDEVFIVEQSLALLTELAGSDSVSRIVASAPVLACVNLLAQQLFEVEELVFCVFRLVFQLSFVRDNIAVLIQSDVPQLIVSAVDHEQHGKSEKIMLTCMSVLGNMAVTEPSCVPNLHKVRARCS